MCIAVRGCSALGGKERQKGCLPLCSYIHSVYLSRITFTFANEEVSCHISHLSSLHLFVGDIYLSVEMAPAWCGWG
jgi:hypothetical protein